MPGSTLRYGSNFWMRTVSPRSSSSAPSDAAVRPLPSDETTPPVTKMYFIELAYRSAANPDKKKLENAPSREVRFTHATYFLYQLPSSFCSHTPGALAAAICRARARPTVSADEPVCFAIAA